MMEIRNTKVISEDVIDCEINHPKFGWIPFTASRFDEEEHGRLVFEACLSFQPEPGV